MLLPSYNIPLTSFAIRSILRLEYSGGLMDYDVMPYIFLYLNTILLFAKTDTCHRFLPHCGTNKYEQNCQNSESRSNLFGVCRVASAFDEVNCQTDFKKPLTMNQNCLLLHSVLAHVSQAQVNSLSFRHNIVSILFISTKVTHEIFFFKVQNSNIFLQNPM